MGNNIPRDPCAGCLNHRAYVDSAKTISAREQLIEQREQKKAQIKEETLLRRICKLGTVWQINTDIDHELTIIDMLRKDYDGVDAGELAACPGLYTREAVIYSDEHGPDFTQTEIRCGIRARLNNLDVSEQEGWRLKNVPDKNQDSL